MNRFSFNTSQKFKLFVHKHSSQMDFHFSTENLKNDMTMTLGNKWASHIRNIQVNNINGLVHCCYNYAV